MYLGFSKEVFKACEVLNYDCEILSQELTEQLHRKVETLYAVKGSGIALWQRLDDCYSIHDHLAWKKIDRIINYRECIMFFDRDDDMNSVLIRKGASTVNILKECTQFVFYLTDSNYSYLLCFNDHDFLISCGEAKELFSKIH